MSISKNISESIKRYKEENQMSIIELSEELGIAKSAAEAYLNGTGNPRADTLELLAEKCGISVTEMISALPPAWERAEMAVRAARLFSSLAPGKREKATALFLALVDILSEENSA